MRDTLLQLIQVETDALQLYALALDRVDDLAVREDIEGFRTDHERHIAELEQLVRLFGDEPDAPSREVIELAFEGLVALRAATGTNGALSALRLHERHANGVLDDALDAGLPPIAYELVMSHLEDERRHLALIEMHIDRLAPHHEPAIQPPASTRSPA
jgi:rubrerythrin